MKFNFNYENRNSPQLYKEVGLAIVEIVSKTPNGVIVFVPSYDVLDKIRV